MTSHSGPRVSYWRLRLASQRRSRQLIQRSNIVRSQMRMADNVRAVPGTRKELVA